MICLGRLEIHVALSHLNIELRILAQSYFVTILVYPDFELDTEQDKIGKPWLIKQETDRLVLTRLLIRLMRSLPWNAVYRTFVRECLRISSNLMMTKLNSC